MSICWSIAITTAPRAVNYLPATIESLYDAGWPPEELVISCESGRTPNRWLPKVKCVDFHPKPPGCWRNFRWALDFLYKAQKRYGEADYLLVCEDDIYVAPGLRDYLDAHPPPAGGVVSLYTAAPNYHDQPGWHPLQVRRPIRTYGALALAFPPEIARLLLDDPPAPHRPEGTDHWVGKFCQIYGVPFCAHTPSFVRHTGFVSTMPDAGGPENRQSGLLWGEKIDSP